MVYWLASPLYVESWYWLEPAIVLLAAIGLFRPFVSANLAMAGTRFLGPTVSSTLSATSPVFGLLLGRFVFRESELDMRATLAVACVVPGVILVSL